MRIYNSGEKAKTPADLKFVRYVVTGLFLILFVSAATAQNIPNGFAAVSGEGESTTTGGGDVASVTVTTYSQLSNAVSGNAPRVIILSGSVTTPSGGAPLKIGSNKTLIGADKNATINGGIEISRATNVIVRNLNIKGVGRTGANNSTNHVATGPWDTGHIQAAHHIWIDHCSFSDAGDGLLDITSGASYVTVSWCKFYYTDSGNTHRLACLIGSGGGNHPRDWGYLKVTYHHNWFSTLVKERMPRLMYGQAHVYDNYYTCAGDLYCIGVGSYGSMLIENNYFKGVKNPHRFMYDVWCYMTVKDNVYDNCTGTKASGRGGSRDVAGQENFDVQPFNVPPYSYTLDDATNVPGIVSKGAGPQSAAFINGRHS